MTTRARQHTQEELDELHRFNILVPFYLWIALVGILVLASFKQLATHLIASSRYRYSKRVLRLKAGLPSSHRGSVQTVAEKDATRGIKAAEGATPVSPADEGLDVRGYLPHLAKATLAIWRKYATRKHWLATQLHLQSTGQLLLIVAYIGLNVGLVLGGAKGDIDWRSHHAARLANANLPLVIGLASKNNVLAYLTGFSYHVLNAIHRWSARLVIILSLIHIGGRSYVNVPRVAPTGPGQAYIVWGIVATLLLAILHFTSFHPVRNRFYQTFIISHVLLFVFFFIALAIHRPQTAPFLYAGLGIYVVDRVVRTGRIIYYHYFKPTREKINAWVKVLPGDTMRVTLRTRMRWRAGQHVYLHVPDISVGGHPFSISSIDHELGMPFRPHDQAESTQRLLIRVREGMTGRLRDFALAHKEGHLEANSSLGVPIGRAWIEGPMGALPPFRDHQTVCLVAGGSGITFITPILCDLVSRALANMRAGYASTTATTLVKVHWNVRSLSHIEWIADTLRECIALSPPGFLEFTIHCSQIKETTAHYLTSEDDARPVSLLVQPGRPNYEVILEDVINLTDRSDWVACGTCGPSPMSEAVARAVQKSIQPRAVMRGENRRLVTFFREEFGY
ncbi:uncharacterized protein L969DRAFT_614835 [Mixia osmundae IAM 14324]|uniref:ferric-chelate reductase (NADPH) n=1 Tax=Mixia osmundae (strain CBS 9802 / IAM 14324 / JCM 22182 / KY 12970) TaxID=764103 RepID=G7DXY0_MIXOS|nr:uncharacterized protein L969DRAFT_614835 [Mixia osmundae IAM 14324]KEI41343.1 hypothetical protein L969DRAFT_614835 [Mixia osmundae IAM 14324]GAA95440.1 hypothetical protein E5Q_02094 [Mixia osmundae IAM 14324]